MRKPTRLILLATVLLAACTKPPTGVWRGSMNSTTNQKTSAALNIITSDKQSYLKNDSTGIVFIGAVSVTTDKLQGTLARYLPAYNAVSIDGVDTFMRGTASSTASINGAIVANVSISGSYSTSDDNGALALNYDANTFERSAALSLVSGNWTFTDASGFSLTVAINASGNWAGSDTTGCNSNGSIALIDPTKNIYRVTVTETACGQYDGSYTGVATLSDRLTTNDTLSVFLYNSNTAFAFDLTKT